MLLLKRSGFARQLDVGELMSCFIGSALNEGAPFVLQRLMWWIGVWLGKERVARSQRFRVARSVGFKGSHAGRFREMGAR